MGEQRNIRRTIEDTYRSVYSYLKPISNVSAFIERGVLTPQEFLDAGNFLVHKFKSWEWQTTEKNRKVTYLPDDKQFLLRTSVPCRHRLQDLNYIWKESQIVEDEWILPNYKEDCDEVDLTESTRKKSSSSNNHPKEKNVLNKSEVNKEQEEEQKKEQKEGKEQTERQEEEEEEEEEEEIDISNFDINESIFRENDPACASSSDSTSDIENVDTDNNETIQVRTYDISVTYDKYYQTPRIWLYGYSENGHPLTVEEMFEDILGDYQNQTVTYDLHPCTGLMSASIHPCRQSDILLKVVKRWIETGLEPRHDLTILILLKNISTIAPAIEFDFTMDIEMSMYLKS